MSRTTLLSLALFLFGSTIALAAPPTDPVPSSGQIDAPPVEGPVAPAEYEDPILRALEPDPNGLTSEEVARRAVESSPAIAAKQASVELAEAQLDSTLYQFLPRVELSFSYTRLSQAQIDLGGGGNLVGAQTEGLLTYGPCAPGSLFNCVIDSAGVPVSAVAVDFGIDPPPLDAYSLQAQLGVPISDYIARLPTAKKASKAQIKANELARDAEQLTTQKDARVAYYNWVRATIGVVALQESLLRTKARLVDVQATFDAGVATKAEVLQLEASVATLTATIIKAENLRDLASESLDLIMGETGFTPHTIGEDLLAPESPMADTDDLEDLIVEAQTERLEGKALAATRQSVDSGIKTARAGYYPRLDGFADATYANPNQRFFPLAPVWNGSWAAGVRLSWVLGDAIRASAKVDELEATRRQIDAQAAQLDRGIAIEVAAAWAQRQASAAAVEYTRQAREAAAASYQVAVDLFQAGEATSTDILIAEYEQVSTTLSAINTRLDLRIANLELEYAVGRLEPLVTEAPPGSMPAR